LDRTRIVGLRVNVIRPRADAEEQNDKTEPDNSNISPKDILVVMLRPQVIGPSVNQRWPMVSTFFEHFFTLRLI